MVPSTAASDGGTLSMLSLHWLTAKDESEEKEEEL